MEIQGASEQIYKAELQISSRRLTKMKELLLKAFGLAVSTVELSKYMKEEGEEYQIGRAHV